MVRGITQPKTVQYFTKGSKARVSKHFMAREFDCNCKFPSCCKTFISQALVEKLEEKRVQFDKPIYLNSGYRCRRWNEICGSNDRSQHRKGKAADIIVPRLAPRKVADACEDFPGLGRYKSFTHVDVRGPNKAGRKKFRWGKN